MPKKKKKSRASSGSIGSPGGQSIKSPGSRNNGDDDVISKPSEDIMDLISLRLVRGTSSSPSDSGRKSLRYSPQILLTESDARQLDVRHNDTVILISTTAATKNEDSSSPLSSQEVFRTAIAQVSVSSNRPGAGGTPTTSISSSPMDRNRRSSKLTPGHCHVYPMSLSNSLLDSPIPADKQKTSQGSQNPQTPVTPPRTNSSSTSTPSSSKSKFSFAQGGGGDLLISPTSATKANTPVTPSSSHKSSSFAGRQLFVIPLDSNLGESVMKLISAEANRMYIVDPTNRLLQTQHLGERLMLAHTIGTYLGNAMTIQVSFQGQRLDCEIREIETNETCRIDDVISDFQCLSLKDKSSERENVEMAVLEALRKSISENTRHSQFLKLYRVSYETKVSFSGKETVKEKTVVEATTQKPLVAGLELTIEEIRSLLETPLIKPHLFQGSLRPPRGVLLHGPSGVGKSCLAKQIARRLQRTAYVQHINCTSLQSLTPIIGQAERRLSKIFESAEQNHVGKSGSLVILDDVHLICPRRQGTNIGTDRLCATLLALLDGIGVSSSSDSTESTVVVLAITSNPSLLDPALRRPGRLDAEVEVPLPDEPATRGEILQFQLESLSGMDSVHFSRTEFLSLARLAKGFTGADCKLAVKEAIRNALLRQQKEGNMLPEQKINVTLDDLERAIRLTKPSAIRSVTVEIPQVYWSSIGGMEDVKRELREAVELPITHGHVFERLRIRPPRGVLLYGPPGCSKTLMARALATEGQMNFLAVKGPELLSKWLGESERALASLFKRARLASPSVIFFDEIDAIASKRGGNSSGGGERILSQLLTEIDGIQSGNSENSSIKKKKQRVLVVGATNRPDLLDSALMRPGRIDRMIYVGIPDEASRASIFKLGLQRRSCADDILIHHLAQDQVSGGLSGAEVVAACRNAALLALEDEDIEESPKDISDGPLIRMRHLLQAIDGMERQITREMLDFYDSYRGGR